MESSITTKPYVPCHIIIFGASGDLTKRKLFPALNSLFHESLIHPLSTFIGFARRTKTNDLFSQEMRSGIESFARPIENRDSCWGEFSKRIRYVPSSFDDDSGYIQLKKLLDDEDALIGQKCSRVYYLSTQPKYFTVIAQKLHHHNLLSKHSKDSSQPFSRVIIEKPFGHDLESAHALQKNLISYLKEEQIYRIDHFLGKEPIQNLLPFRYHNPFFENQWNNKFIKKITINICEAIGIGTRGKFFEESGIVRDIIQNHAMQILSLICMELPATLDDETIRDAKVAVINSLRTLNPEDYDSHAFRAQYIGYRDEEFVSENSSVETFATFIMYVESERFKNVPIQINAGKKLARKETSITIDFSENSLVFHIQPKEEIRLSCSMKAPGHQGLQQQKEITLNYDDVFSIDSPEAYEKLLRDCILGDSTLFTREDEVFASWKYFTPILEYWKQKGGSEIAFYPPEVRFPKQCVSINTQDGIL